MRFAAITVCILLFGLLPADSGAAEPGQTGSPSAGTGRPHRTEPGSVAAEEAEPVRVYTNADLEKYADGSSEPAVVGPAEQAGWVFVARFLEAEYERLDAQREYELRRTRLEREPIVVGRPFLPFPFFHHHRCHLRCPIHGKPKRPRIGIPEKKHHGGGGFGIHRPDPGRSTHRKGQPALPGPPAHSVRTKAKS